MALYATGTGQTIWGVHEASECKGRYCTIHNPSLHAMRTLPTHWRQDRGLMERICKHGIGHPDPDHLAYVLKTQGVNVASTESVHGCCGECCKGAYDHVFPKPEPIPPTNREKESMMNLTTSDALKATAIRLSSESVARQRAYALAQEICTQVETVPSPRVYLQTLRDWLDIVEEKIEHPTPDFSNVTADQLETGVQYGSGKNDPDDIPF